MGSDCCHKRNSRGSLAGMYVGISDGRWLGLKFLHFLEVTTRRNAIRRCVALDSVRWDELFGKCHWFFHYSHRFYSILPVGLGHSVDSIVSTKQTKTATRASYDMDGVLIRGRGAAFVFHSPKIHFPSVRQNLSIRSSPFSMFAMLVA